MTTCCFSETRDLDETRIDALSHTLSLGERQRSDRFGRWHDRRDYIAAHALLRMVLAAQTNTSPEHLNFDADNNGKPYLVHASGEAPPAFSLTHARGLVACVVAEEGAVGIDAEPVNPAVDADRLANRFFSADEAADLQRCSARDRPTRFYQLWTLKEALLKAVGTGLISGLDSVSFRVDGHHVSLTTRFAPFAEVPWVFVVVSVAGSHTLALAISDTGRSSLPVSLTKRDLARPAQDGQIMIPFECAIGRHAGLMGDGLSHVSVDDQPFVLVANSERRPRRR